MAIVTLYPEREDRWAEEKRQRRMAQGTALVKCRDGVWRSVNERAAFEALTDGNAR